MHRGDIENYQPPLAIPPSLPTTRRISTSKRSQPALFSQTENAFVAFTPFALNPAFLFE
jgi:hypothetical protein